MDETSPWKPVSELQTGDHFGPLANDEKQARLIVVVAAHAGLRGAGGGLRNLWRVTDQFGRVWQTGGRRLSGDCYGWERVR